MAYTLDEIFANSAPATMDDFPTVSCVLVITQEDGRTAYTYGDLEVKINDRVLDSERIQFNPPRAYFSDRNLFTGPHDKIGMQVSKVNDVTCHVTSILLSWGSARQELDVSLPNDFAVIGKTYIGRGNTIGGGSGRALNCLSFVSLGRDTVLG
jgi:hypothetical protein